MMKNYSKEKGKKTKILFVCLGNICRSPAAEGILKNLVDKKGISEQFYIDSAGTGGWHVGELPDERMREHGAQRGYNFCSRARKFNIRDFNSFDYIVVMDEKNYATVASMTSDDDNLKKIKMMMDFAQQYTLGHVPDPYYGDSADFELALDLLEDACEGLLKHLGY